MREKIKKEWLPKIYKVWTTEEELTREQKTFMLNKEFGTNFGESAFRKKAKTYGEGLQAGLEDNATDIELDRIAKAKSRAIIEQKKATLIKTKMHKDARVIGQRELILKMVEESVKDRYVGMEKLNINVDVNKKHKEWVIELTIADMHYTGKKDNQQVKKVFQTIIKTIQRYNIVGKNTRIILTFLGDDVEGFLHKGQSLDIQMLTIQQALHLAPLYWEGIKKVNSFTKNKYGINLEIHFVRESNHGQTRQMGSQRGEFAKEDVGYIISRELKTHISYTQKEHGIKFVESGKDGTIVDKTTKTVKFHGDKPWMRNSSSIKSYIPKGYNALGAHLHHLVSEQFEGRFLMKSPAAKAFRNQYESELGVSSDSAIGVILYKNGVCEGMSVSRIE